jgi:multidrug efflux pump subunit AcrA (membrane-fusion protein)
LDQLDKQQAQEQDEKAKKQAEDERKAAEQARLDREAIEQKRIDQANLAAEQTRLAQEAAARQAQEQAQQKAENERQKPIIRENERQQIERISVSVLQNDPHIYRVEHMDEALKRAGVDVWIVDSKRRMALTGSENEFSTADIRPGGRGVGELVSEQMAANSARVEREIARDNDRERD